MDWSILLGLKVKCYRGFPNKNKYSKEITAPLQFILFDDGKTFIELREQDYYTYHDCSAAARELYLQQDKELWTRLYEKQGWDEPTNLNYPF